MTKKLKQFAEEKRISGKEGKEKSSVNDVAQMVKRMPQYQKELNNYATHMHLAEDCMREYQHKVAEICKVEQVSFVFPLVCICVPCPTLSGDYIAFVCSGPGYGHRFGEREN